MSMICNRSMVPEQDDGRYEAERYALCEIQSAEVGLCDVSDEAWKKDIGELSLDLSGSSGTCYNRVAVVLPLSC